MRPWRPWSTLVIGCVLLGRVRAQQGLPSESVTAIPFELASDFLVVVEGQAGEMDGLKFIVDTGATRSVIDRKVAAKLHLRRHTGQIMNFDRFVLIEWADVPVLRMGPLRAEDVTVMVVNLAEYSELAKGVDGIIGLDLLSRSDRFIIDYRERRLYFALTAKRTSRPVPGCFIVPVVVQGLTMRLGVDTGIAGVLFYSDGLRKRGVKTQTEGEPKRGTLGRIKGTNVTVPGVQVGGPEEVISAILIDGPREGILPGLDGYLGVASLHAKRVEFDFAKMTLRWQ